MPLTRAQLLPEEVLPKGRDLINQGRALARDWPLGPSAFLREYGYENEAAFKRASSQKVLLMQHAQIGYRDLDKSCRAYAEIFDACQAEGVMVHRYGLCLDWSMGFPRDQRIGALRGTGMILDEVEDFVRLANAAPVAPHFGDFVLGFPAALENTQAALAAGSTAIGNLGQYFTFRLPHHDDDVDATRATLIALALIAAQEQEILVHSNLDDGFAAVFEDLASVLGFALLERHIVTDLIGAPVSHCFGHHFSDPLPRLAFHRALASLFPEVPGTMLYGATVLYQGGAAANYASMASYLTADILGQRLLPSGHALNPVPISENQRIPEIDEVIDAQLHLGQLIETTASYSSLIDLDPIIKLSEKLIVGAKQFYKNVLEGFEEAGIDVQDPFEMLLSLRRIGGRQLERLFGAGTEDSEAKPGRRPVVPSVITKELEQRASDSLVSLQPKSVERIRGAGLKGLCATTDVHEHGKRLIEIYFEKIGVTALDGGVSVDAEDLAEQAATLKADFIAVSTYNGVALSYVVALRKALAARGLTLPVLVGGRLNQIPEASNTSLPVDVTGDIEALGVHACGNLEDAVRVLAALIQQRDTDPV